MTVIEKDSDIVIAKHCFREVASFDLIQIQEVSQYLHCCLVGPLCYATVLV